jgi:hypothetical protein
MYSAARNRKPEGHINFGDFVTAFAARLIDPKKRVRVTVIYELRTVANVINLF